MKEPQTMGRDINSFFQCQDFVLHTCRPFDDAGFDYRKVMACIQIDPFFFNAAILAAKYGF
jgi:hypothetical protein